MENKIDTLDKFKQRIRSRKCPYCGALIKHYVFSSINIPFEYMARSSAENREESGSRYSFYTWGNNSLVMFSRVLLTATCQCGNISFWECENNDIKALISNDMAEDGYFIELIYSKDTVKDMYDKTTDEKFKKDLEEVLKIFPENEGKKE